LCNPSRNVIYHEIQNHNFILQLKVKAVSSNLPFCGIVVQNVGYVGSRLIIVNQNVL
jgi:hypothetical protein